MRGWLPKLSDNPYVVEYGADLVVPRDFGQPGAVVVTNFHDKEFFLMEIVVQGFSAPVFFRADTWIHSRKDNPESRIIFKNQVAINKLVELRPLSVFGSLMCLCVVVTGLPSVSNPTWD